MTYSAKCVGGPHDGKVMAWPTSTFKVAVPREITPLDVTELLADPLGTELEYNTIIYVFKSVTIGGAHVWTPDNQTWRETITKLIEGYKP